MITLSICLSDIPKDKIVEAKNGKKYINLVMNERKEVGQYGETHGISVSRTKEEREANETIIWVGSGKEYNFNNAPQQKASNPKPVVASANDLPF